MDKESKYYWIKLKMNIFDDDSPLDYLLSLPEGAEYVVLYIKLCMMTANKQGRLCNCIGEVIIPYDVEKIAKEMKYFSVNTVRVALELYAKLGLIYSEDNGVLRIANFSEIVGSETVWAAKKRDYRNQLKEKNGIEIEDNSRTMSSESPKNCPQKSRTMSDKSIDIRDKSIDTRDIDTRIHCIPNTIDNNGINNTIVNNGDNNTLVYNNNTKGTRPRNKSKEKVVYFPNDEKLENAFQEFIAWRKSIKKPMSELAIKRALGDLEKVATVNGVFDNDKAYKAIEYTLVKGWLTFYSTGEDRQQKSTDQGFNWDAFKDSEVQNEQE